MSEHEKPPHRVLAEAMSKTAGECSVAHMLAALGILVADTLFQIEEGEERAAAVVAWLMSLVKAMEAIDAHRQRRKTLH